MGYSGYQSYYRVPSWCWVRTKEDGSRLRATWAFNSVDNANRWRKNRCWKYAEHGTIEEYLRTVPESRQVAETKRWIEHRDLYNSLELYRSYILFPRLNEEEEYEE